MTSGEFVQTQSVDDAGYLVILRRVFCLCGIVCSSVLAWQCAKSAATGVNVSQGILVYAQILLAVAAGRAYSKRTKEGWRLPRWFFLFGLAILIGIVVLLLAGSPLIHGMPTVTDHGLVLEDRRGAVIREISRQEYDALERRQLRGLNVIELGLESLYCGLFTMGLFHKDSFAQV